MKVSGRREITVRSRSRRTVLSVTAWTFVLLGTFVPEILTAELFGTEPVWLLPARIVAIGGLLALTVTVRWFRPLRPFGLALLAAIALFNVRYTWYEFLGITIQPGVWSLLATKGLGLLVAVGLLGVLFVVEGGRDRLFLRSGHPSETADREWIPGFRRERPWWQVALLWGGIPGLLLIGFYAVSGRFPVEQNAMTLARFVPVLALAAVLNAFIEESIFRAAPLAGLVDALGKRHALVLLGAFFGFSHYYGSPGGLTGVAMTSFYGWLLAKSILETRGLGVALVIHFFADFIIYLTYLS